MNNLLAPAAIVRAASAREYCIYPFVVLLLYIAPQLAQAQGCRPQDDLWFIDSRPAACNAKDAAGLPRVTAQRRLADGRWHRSSLAEFIADDTGLPTIIWVHGNRVSSGEGRQRGWEFYYALTRHADPSPKRVVIWSWPADQVRGPLKDIRFKAMLTEPAAYHLAQVLVRLNPEQPLGLVGFSYGSRVITGALHLQAGGRLGGYELPQQNEAGAGPRSNVVLWASALHHDWLLPGRYHGETLGQVEHVTLLNNSCDRALQRYRLVDRCSNPLALGYVGLAGGYCLAENQHKVVQQDVCCQIGQVHTSCNYIQNSRIMLRTWEGLRIDLAQAKEVASSGLKTAKKETTKGK